MKVPSPFQRELRAAWVAAALTMQACASGPDLQETVLRAPESFGSGSFVRLHSFSAGELGVPPPDPGLVDLVVAFDGDDMFEGALIGHDERRGFLFPLGQRPWSELVELRPPTTSADSVVAIAPLTDDKLGLAFWVRTGRGEHVLVKIKTLEPATYADLVGGATPTLVLEWWEPQL